MKNILKRITIKKIVIIIISIFIILEIINISNDIYNFRNLDKIKNIISIENLDEYDFKTINIFNNSLKQNIKPIRNCYYIKKNKNKNDFVFGFKIYSLLYKIMYSSNYYVYPESNTPKKLSCSSLCHDIIEPEFIKVISNPCRD